MSAKGYAVWLPLYEERRRWSDRWKVVSTPLFPGYLFVNNHGAGVSPLLRTPGVLTVVKNGSVPAELSSGYVQRLQAVVADPTLDVEPVADPPIFVEGEEVLVREGPLQGFRGVVEEVRGERKLLLWLPLVGRGMRCTIGSAAVSKASAA